MKKTSSIPRPGLVAGVILFYLVLALYSRIYYIINRVNNLRGSETMGIAEFGILFFGLIAIGAGLFKLFGLAD